MIDFKIQKSKEEIIIVDHSYGPEIPVNGAVTLFLIVVDPLGVSYKFNIMEERPRGYSLSVLYRLIPQDLEVDEFTNGIYTFSLIVDGASQISKDILIDFELDVDIIKLFGEYYYQQESEIESFFNGTKIYDPDVYTFYMIYSMYNMLLVISDKDKADVHLKDVQKIYKTLKKLLYVTRQDAI